jgi:1,4-alpha-glucan branching enzyme
MTSAGIPMMFMGQEWSSHQDFVFDQVPDLDWSQVGTYTKSSGWSRVGPYKGLFDLSQTLVGLRLNKNGTSSGLARYIH